MMKKRVLFAFLVVSIFFVSLPDQKHNHEAEAADSSLDKDVPNDTDCAFCNMVVYQKKDTMGVFSGQATKKDDKVVYYDDIGCLLYDEVKNKTTNKKYVRDYNTLKWIKAEKATYVKTTLASPMDDGYIVFNKASDAKAYVKKNKDSKIVSYKKVREEMIEKYK